MSDRRQRILAFLRRHLVKFVAVLVCLLALCVYLAGRRLYYDYHLAASERAAARFEFDEARDHLAACLRLRPNDAGLHFTMARVERRAGRYDVAEDHLRQCQKLEGIRPANALEWSMLRMQEGEVVEQERVLQAWVDKSSPDTPLILEAMAQGYIHTYRLEGAMYCLDRLLEMQPDNVLALLWRAHLWQTVGNRARAEPDYRRAMELQPDLPQARVELGDYLLLCNRPEEAAEQYEYVHQRHPDHTRALLGLARCCLRTSKRDEGKVLLDALLLKAPHDADALVERGNLALGGEAPADAESFFRAAVAEEPCNMQAHYLLAQCLQQEGKDEEARKHRDATERIEADLKRLETVFGLVAQNPHDPAPRREAGLICLRNGQEKEGERWLLSALQEAPQDEATNRALADHFEQAGKPDLAAPYRQAAASSRGAPAVLPAPAKGSRPAPN